MPVWTISAQEGSGGQEVAARLAETAGVPLIDRAALVDIAVQLGLSRADAQEIERRLHGRLNELGLSLAVSVGVGEAVRELQFLAELPDLGRRVLAEAARRPCVILAASAFVALRDHTSAVHARIWAPLEWRIERFAREQLVDRADARHEVMRNDHLHDRFVRRLYHVDANDYRQFTLACDASRLHTEGTVQLLLGAARLDPLSVPSLP